MVRVKYILKFFGHVISLERVNLYKLENRSAFCKDREEGRRGKGKGRQKRRRGKETVYLVMLKPPKRKFIILILCISVPSPCPCHDQIWLRDPRYFVAKINLDWHNVVLTGRKTAEKTAILTKFWNLVVLLRIYLLSPIRAKFGHPRYAITMPIFIPIGFFVSLLRGGRKTNLAVFSISTPSGMIQTTLNVNPQLQTFPYPTVLNAPDFRRLKCLIAISSLRTLQFKKREGQNTHTQKIKISNLVCPSLARSQSPTKSGVGIEEVRTIWAPQKLSRSFVARPIEGRWIFLRRNAPRSYTHNSGTSGTNP